MRMKKLVVGLLVLGLAVGVVGMIGFAGKPVPVNPVPVLPSDSASDKVTWTIQRFIELKIADPSFDFGTISAGVDKVTEKNANTLFVFSNTKWELSFSVMGSGSAHLAVDLSEKEGKGDAKVNVGYTLSNLRSMNPGNYVATVIYTATAK